MTFRLIWSITILLMLASWILPGSRTGKAGHDQLLSGNIPEITNILEKYQSLHESALKPDAFIFGMAGYRSLLSRGLVKNDSLGPSLFTVQGMPHRNMPTVTVGWDAVWDALPCLLL